MPCFILLVLVAVLSPSPAQAPRVWSGQATSYMIGQQRIVELRETARAALGDRFSLQEFYNVVLRLGNVPLRVLGEEVQAWIASYRR